MRATSPLQRDSNLLMGDVAWDFVWGLGQPCLPELAAAWLANEQAAWDAAKATLSTLLSPYAADRDVHEGKGSG
jgi:hypothetical protein